MNWVATQNTRLAKVFNPNTSNMLRGGCVEDNQVATNIVLYCGRESYCSAQTCNFNSIFAISILKVIHASMLANGIIDIVAGPGQFTCTTFIGTTWTTSTTRASACATRSCTAVRSKSVNTYEYVDNGNRALIIISVCIRFKITMGEI